LYETDFDFIKYDLLKHEQLPSGAAEYHYDMDKHEAMHVQLVD
jgi:hypothetical protein